MTELRTTITAVTVYPDRARVTRQGSVKLEKGAHQLGDRRAALEDRGGIRRAPRRAARPGRACPACRSSGLITSRPPPSRSTSWRRRSKPCATSWRALKPGPGWPNSPRANLAELAGSTETYALALASGEQDVAEQLALFDSLRARAGEIDQEIIESGGAKKGAGAPAAKNGKGAQALAGSAGAGSVYRHRRGRGAERRGAPRWS